MPADELPNYELLDFGKGRKLERFGPWILDRPAPGVDELVAQPALWKNAIARYEANRVASGSWSPAVKRWPERSCEFAVQWDNQQRFILQLAPLPSGQVGVFPEQLANWRWISQQVGKSSARGTLRVLNLFAYTGGSTLAAAASGAEVTHVDAAKSVVARARVNAELSGLEVAPIRWIVEDSLKFCQREVRRGNHYDAVILDPPSYGHGPKGESWSIQRDLLSLLELCGKLTSSGRAFALCTCHTPSIAPADLSAYVSQGLVGHCGQPPQTGKLFLATAEGRKLSSGVFARWPA